MVLQLQPVLKFESMLVLTIKFVSMLKLMLELISELEFEVKGMKPSFLSSLTSSFNVSLNSLLFKSNAPSSKSPVLYGIEKVGRDPSTGSST